MMLIRGASVIAQLIDEALQGVNFQGANWGASPISTFIRWDSSNGMYASGEFLLGTSGLPPHFCVFATPAFFPMRGGLQSLACGIYQGQDRTVSWVSQSHVPIH
eukprot:1158208-Pelagomonas_calceolata.AAC.28